MKTAPFAVFAFATLLCASAFGAAADYRIVNRIKVPDGGFDYATFDSANGRVLLARTNFTTVIDAKTATSRNWRGWL